MKYIKLFIILCLININISAVRAEDNEFLSLEIKGLSLEECIKLSIDNSFEVKLAKLDFLIAETDQGIAEAIFDTILSADISYEDDRRQSASILAGDHVKTHTFSADATKKFPAGTKLTASFDNTRTWSDSSYASTNPAYESEITLEARQPIAKNRFGYLDKRNITLTSLAIKNADLDRKNRIESLLAQVETAYWEWAFSKKGLEVYRKILDKARELHETNEKNYDMGLIEMGDLLASQANVIMREKDILIAANKYRRSEEKIKAILNMDASSRVYPKDPLEYKKIAVDLEECLATAFKMRRDYYNSKRDIEIKNIVLETKENERWPEIDLVASIAANGIDSEFGNALGNMAGEGNIDYFLGVEFSLPIENNLTTGEFRKAEHNKEKAIITLKKIERSIVTEIGDAVRDYVTSEVNVDKIMEAAKLQREKLKEEEKRFTYGRSNTKRVIDYQQDYLAAQLEVAKSMSDLEVARVNLEKAMNIILEKYEGLL